MLGKYDKMKKERQDLLNKMVEEVKKNLQPAVDKLFEKHPLLQKIQWVQYYPGFNDGDPCLFQHTCCDPAVWFQDPNEADEPDMEYLPHKDYRQGIDPQWCEAYEDIRNLLASLDEDTLLSLYGEFARVSFRRENGVQVEDYYDHS